MLAPVWLFYFRVEKEGAERGMEGGCKTEKVLVCVHVEGRGEKRGGGGEQGAKGQREGVNTADTMLQYMLENIFFIDLSIGVSCD